MFDEHWDIKRIWLYGHLVIHIHNYSDIHLSLKAYLNQINGKDIKLINDSYSNYNKDFLRIRSRNYDSLYIFWKIDQLFVLKKSYL